MRDEISEMLDGTIEKLIKKIDDLTPGTPEHSSAVECLNKLYKLKIEETSHEREFMAKCDHDAVTEREMAFKREQAWWGRVMDGLKLAVEVLGVALPLCAYTVFVAWGFSFEEKGTITSKIFQNITSWYKPKK